MKFKSLLSYLLYPNSVPCSSAYDGLQDDYWVGIPSASPTLWFCDSKNCPIWWQSAQALGGRGWKVGGFRGVMGERESWRAGESWQGGRGRGRAGREAVCKAERRCRKCRERDEREGAGGQTEEKPTADPADPASYRNMYHFETHVPVCVFVCVCVWEKEWKCVCVCVWERERDDESVCVCVWERVKVSVCVRERDSESEWVCV